MASPRVSLATGEEVVPTVTSDLVDGIENAIESGDEAAARSAAAALHAADLADLLLRLRPESRPALVRILGDGLDPDVFGYLDEDVRDALVAQIGPTATAKLVAELDSDDAVYVVEDLDAEQKRRVLEALPLGDRALIEQGLAFKEESAGRLMQRELVAVREFWTVGETIDYMRASADLPDDFYNIFVVDGQWRPIGVVPLSRLMRTRRPVTVADIMFRDVRTVSVDTDQEEVAFLFRRYGLVEVPVVEAKGRLVGVVTFDDLVEVVEEKASEDALHLAGVEADAPARDVLRTAASRFTWLFVNLATAILASAVIALFEETIERTVALAVLMPIVASMGGNAGTQTLAVAVRALATRQVLGGEGWRLIAKETMVGTLNGASFALVCGAVAWAWTGSVAIGSIMGMALVANLVVAGLAGAAIPLALERAGVDPAIASGVFLTTVTDVVGFFAFLALATLLLL
ncbi:MAG: magnesium transporter [Alphaproteobacteria bacterium]|nr:magnesium transporter [Alphaproteobacteria bacterium]